jgi:DNA end-binding protein Ku
MLELASHIVETKSGHFEPEKFKDQYEDALKELLKKKQAGEKIEAPKERAPAKIINLMDALRRSVEAGRGGAAKRQAASAKARCSDSDRPKKKKSR